MPLAPLKKCETCDTMAIRGQRFCKTCKKHRLTEMKEAGYLTPKPSQTYRSPDQRENTSETKFGKDQGQANFIAHFDASRTNFKVSHYR